MFFVVHDVGEFKLFDEDDACGGGTGLLVASTKAKKSSSDPTMVQGGFRDELPYLFKDA